MPVRLNSGVWQSGSAMSRRGEEPYVPRSHPQPHERPQGSLNFRPSCVAHVLQAKIQLQVSWSTERAPSMLCMPKSLGAPEAFMSSKCAPCGGSTGTKTRTPGLTKYAGLSKKGRQKQDCGGGASEMFSRLWRVGGHPTVLLTQSSVARVFVL